MSEAEMAFLLLAEAVLTAVACRARAAYPTFSCREIRYQSPTYGLLPRDEGPISDEAPHRVERDLELELEGYRLENQGAEGAGRIYGESPNSRETTGADV